MRSFMILGALYASAPIVVAQKSSITSSANMVPLMSATAPAVTMAWDDKPTAAAGATSLGSASQSISAPASMMTMAGGSVMPLGAMSGMASGTGRLNTTGMNFTGAAHRVEAVEGARGLGFVATGFSIGFGVIVALL